ncbi:MAG: hypothetical protein ABSE48_11355 [Verrucomicrobiota bacterium]
MTIFNVTYENKNYFDDGLEFTMPAVNGKPVGVVALSEINQLFGCILGGMLFFGRLSKFL